MKKTTIIFFSIFVIFSCIYFNKCNADIINDSNNLNISFGIYNTQKYSFFNKAILYLKGVRHLPKINTLNIMEDSSFYYEACRKSSYGNWKIVNDTLFLFEYKSEDSILNIPPRQKKYKIIDKNTLDYVYNDNTSYQRLTFKKRLQ